LIAIIFMSIAATVNAYQFRNPIKPWKLDHDTAGWTEYNQVLTATSDYVIWKDSSINKVPRYAKMLRRNREFPSRISVVKGADGVTRHEVSGERKSIQIVVTARWNASVHVKNVAVGKLVNDQDESIKSSNIHLYDVGYVNREYPDVLFPEGTFHKVPFGVNR